VIWVFGEAIYFSQEGWTGNSGNAAICPSGKRRLTACRMGGAKQYHRLSFAKMMGFAALYPSYKLKVSCEHEEYPGDRWSE